VSDVDRLKALVPPAFMEADRAVAEAMERERSRGFPTRCARGCAACCRYLIRISLAEALVLREVFDALPAEHRERVAERFLSVRRALDAAGLLAELDGGIKRTPDDPGEDARTEKLLRRYLALDLACPFLEDDACSIYAHRPTPCRQYGVTSDPGLCVDPFALNSRPVPVWPLTRDGLVKECARISGGPERMLVLSLLRLDLEEEGRE
jgi:Fe-S-cluster containining protein